MTYLLGEARGEDAALTTQVESSIVCWGADEWNALVPRDEAQLRHDVLHAVETSGITGAARYIAVRDASGALVGVGVTYEVEIDLLILASPQLCRVAAVLRRGPLRRLLILRSLSCGPVLTNCRPNLFVAPQLSAATREQVGRVLLQTIDALAGGALRLFFEHPPAAVAQFGPALRALGYIQAASLPGTRLDIVWPDFEAYIAAMRKFYRRAVRDDLRAAQDLDIQIVTDFAALADEAFALYNNTVERANNVVERLTPAFFAAISGCEGARLVTAREKASGRLVGIELLLLGDTLVQDLYTGVDYASNARYHTYFNLIYPGIALACESGKRAVSTGQTSYAFKSRLGVQSQALGVFIKHRNPLVHALIARLKNVLCPVVSVPVHRVFRDADPPARVVESVPENAPTSAASQHDGESRLLPTSF